MPPPGSEPPWEPRDDLERILISRWEPIDLAPVLRGERITPVPTVLRRDDDVGLFYPGRINALVGETESLKSWIALTAASQELRAGRHVLVADYEDSPETTVERLRALGVSPDEIGEKLTYLNPGGGIDDLDQAVLNDVMVRRGIPTLAVIDGVTEAMADMGLNPDSGTDVAAYYAGAPKWLAQKGAAVVLVDHVTKNRETRGRFAIGSERKLSGLDGAAYTVETVRPFGRGSTGVVRLAVAKDRCGHIRRHANSRGVILVAKLKSWPDDSVTATLSIPEESDDGTLRPTQQMAQLSKTISENPGLSKTALRAAVRGKNGQKDLALKLLENEDYVEVKEGVRGAHLHYPRRPFVVVKDNEENE
jgi:hypothetical protein